MVFLKIKLQKESYFPGDEVEGWMELKHKGFKPTVVDKLVMKVSQRWRWWCSGGWRWSWLQVCG